MTDEAEEAEDAEETEEYFDVLDDGDDAVELLLELWMEEAELPVVPRILFHRSFWKSLLRAEVPGTRTEFAAAFTVVTRPEVICVASLNSFR